MKKRILALLMAMCLLVGLVPVVSAAEVASGTCGENLTWVLTDDGTLTISGTGPMKNYTNNYGSPWSRYAVKSAVISNGVTTISEYAFANCSSMYSIYIPVSVTTISKYAFYECDGICLWGDVYYAGNYEQWQSINIVPQGNLNLLDADIHYNYTPTPFFSDVPKDSFYYSPVMWAVENNITNGLTETTFGPNEACNRAQVVTFLWRAAGCPEPTVTAHPFVDVSEKAFYYKAMLWAVENGITKGTDATHFSPNAVCNRATVVTFLWRAKGEIAPTSTEHGFTDVSEKAFYYDAMLWAVENGITKGLTATTFGPTESCNRGQVVTFLYRSYVN